MDRPGRVQRASRSLALCLALVTGAVAVAAGPAPTCRAAEGDEQPTPSEAGGGDADGVLDLVGAERRLRYLVVDSNGPDGARGGWQSLFPDDRDPPDDDHTLFLAGSAPAEGPELVPDASFAGIFRGDLRNVTVTLYRGSLLEQHPDQEQLHVTVAVDGIVLFDGNVDVAVTPGRPDVCHTGHYGSYRVGLWNIDRALARAGIAVGPDLRHELRLGFGPGGDGVSSPSVEVFAADTQPTPSALTFNRTRPPVAVQDLGD